MSVSSWTSYATCIGIRLRRDCARLVRVDGSGSGEASDRQPEEDIPKPRLAPKTGARTWATCLRQMKAFFNHLAETGVSQPFDTSSFSSCSSPFRSRGSRTPYVLIRSEYVRLSLPRSRSGSLCGRKTAHDT